MRGFRKLLHQIKHKSIKTDNPKSKNHETGNDLCKLGQKRVNLFDSVKLGELGSGTKMAALRLVYMIITSNQQAFRLENEYPASFYTKNLK